MIHLHSKYGIDFQIKEGLPYRRKSLLGLDIETYAVVNSSSGALCPHTSAIRTLQVAERLDDGSFVVWVHYYNKNSIPPSICFAENAFIAHSARFEYKHLKHHLGIELQNLQCSQVLSSLYLHETEYEKDLPRSLSLKDCAKHLLGIEIDKEQQKSDWSKIELTEEQLEYAAIDAILPLMLYEKCKAITKRKIYKLHTLAIPALADMELNGLLVDKEEHKKQIGNWKEKITNQKKECSKYFGNINLNSSKQLNDWAKRFYASKKSILAELPKSAKTNAYSFNKTPLEHLGEREELASLLAYKKSETLMKTFGPKLAEKISPVTGRLHPSYSLGGTKTGRLSCSNPNLQNMPSRDKEFKKIFIAPEGRALVCADFSQVEIRVAATLSNDPVMLNAFEHALDLHVEIVKDITGATDVTKEMRQLGKAVNFGLAFGMGPTKLAKYARNSYGVSMTEAEARKAWEVYHSKYAVYSRWCTKQRELAKRNGYASTPLGKRRKLHPDDTYTKAVNTPVQGGAAEVMLCSLVYMQKGLSDSWTLLNTVHDEVILECPEGDVTGAKNFVEKCMYSGFEKVFPGAITNGLVEAHAGKTWAEAKG